MAEQLRQTAIEIQNGVVLALTFTPEQVARIIRRETFNHSNA